MGKFMTHEPIAAGAFNHDWCSAGPLLSSWSTELTNTPQIVHLTLQRLGGDFAALHPKMRKPFGLKEVAPEQGTNGGLNFLESPTSLQPHYF